MIAAVIEPAEDPEMIQGRRSWSYNALTTPKWYTAIEAPPESIKAVCPKDYLVSWKNSSFWSTDRFSSSLYSYT